MSTMVLEQVEEQAPIMALRTYQELVTVGSQVRTDADGCDWTMGDIAMELQDLLTIAKKSVDDAKSLKEDPDPEDLELVRSGKELQKKFAKEIGVSNDYIEARRRVSTRIPKAGPLSWIRDSSLSFTHCRALYPIKDDAILDKMANKALSQALTVEQLRNEVTIFNDEQNVQDDKYTCAQCEQKIKDADKMQKVLRNKSTFLLCSTKCLVKIATKFLADEEAQADEEDEDDDIRGGDVIEATEDIVVPEALEMEDLF